MIVVENAVLLLIALVCVVIASWREIFIFAPARRERKRIAEGRTRCHMGVWLREWPPCPPQKTGDKT